MPSNIDLRVDSTGLQWVLVQEPRAGSPNTSARQPKRSPPHLSAECACDTRNADIELSVPELLVPEDYFNTCTAASFGIKDSESEFDKYTCVLHTSLFIPASKHKRQHGKPTATSSSMAILLNLSATHDGCRRLL